MDRAKVIIYGKREECASVIQQLKEGDISSLNKAQIEVIEPQFILGKKGKDKITGLEGIIIGRAEYLFGCTQYGLCPEAKDNKCSDTLWFDEGRIEIIGEGITPESVRVAENGGPQRDNPNNRAGGRL